MNDIRGLETFLDTLRGGAGEIEEDLGELTKIFLDLENMLRKCAEQGKKPPPPEIPITKPNTISSEDLNLFKRIKRSVDNAVSAIERTEITPDGSTKVRKGDEGKDYITSKAIYDKYTDYIDSEQKYKVLSSQYNLFYGLVIKETLSAEEYKGYLTLKDSILRRIQEMLSDTSGVFRFGMRINDIPDNSTAEELIEPIKIGSKGFIKLKDETTSSAKSVNPSIVLSSGYGYFDPLILSDESVFNEYGYIDDLLKNIMDGVNVVIYAYGPTGSGKTYTMIGKQREKITENGKLSDSERKSLIISSLNSLVEKCNKKAINFKITLKVFELVPAPIMKVEIKKNIVLVPVFKDLNRKLLKRVKDTSHNAEDCVNDEGYIDAKFTTIGFKSEKEKEISPESFDFLTNVLSKEIRASESTLSNDNSSRTSAFIEFTFSFDGGKEAKLTFIDLTGLEMVKTSLVKSLETRGGSILSEYNDPPKNPTKARADIQREIIEKHATNLGIVWTLRYLKHFITKYNELTTKTNLNDIISIGKLSDKNYKRDINGNYKHGYILIYTDPEYEYFIKWDYSKSFTINIDELSSIIKHPKNETSTENDIIGNFKDNELSEAKLQGIKPILNIIFYQEKAGSILNKLLFNRYYNNPKKITKTLVLGLCRQKMPIYEEQVPENEKNYRNLTVESLYFLNSLIIDRLSLQTGGSLSKLISTMPINELAEMIYSSFSQRGGAVMYY